MSLRLCFLDSSLDQIHISNGNAVFFLNLDRLLRGGLGLSGGLDELAADEFADEETSDARSRNDGLVSESVDTGANHVLASAAVGCLSL